jgi:hypothetical protein
MAQPATAVATDVAMKTASSGDNRLEAGMRPTFSRQPRKGKAASRAQAAHFLPLCASARGSPRSATLPRRDFRVD